MLLIFTPNYCGGMTLEPYRLQGKDDDSCKPATDKLINQSINKSRRYIVGNRVRRYMRHSIGGVYHVHPVCSSGTPQPVAHDLHVSALRSVDGIDSTPTCHASRMASILCQYSRFVMILGKQLLTGLRKYQLITQSRQVVGREFSLIHLHTLPPSRRNGVVPAHPRRPHAGAGR